MARFGWAPNSVQYGPNRGTMGMYPRVAGGGRQTGGGAGASGSGGFGFEVSVTGVDKLYRIVEGLWRAEIFATGPTPMTDVVRVFGYAWRDNFARQGSWVGGWQPLSQTTLDVKDRRGFSDKKILEQTGSLRDQAIIPFSTWSSSGGSWTKQVKPSANDGTSGGATVTSALQGNKLTISISGAKAAHMVGGGMGRPGRELLEAMIMAGLSVEGRFLPVRPFWFVNSKVTDDAAKVAGGIVFDYLQSELGIVGDKGGHLNMIRSKYYKGA